MMEKLPLDAQRLHHDTTSISVTGEYDHEFKTRIIEITRGHSKDHRDDLKQFVISRVTNQDGIPVFMEPLSGNASDKKILLKSILAVRSTGSRNKQSVTWQIRHFTPVKISYHSAGTASGYALFP
jgi:transposase